MNKDVLNDLKTAVVSAVCVLFAIGALLVGVIQLSNGNIVLGLLCLLVFLIAAYFLFFSLERHYGN